MRQFPCMSAHDRYQPGAGKTVSVGAPPRRIKRRRKALLIIFACAGLAGCASWTGADHRQATYANPVLDSDFPDPAVLKGTDGYYYAYATQGASGAGMLNLQVARSSDLVNWQRLGDGLPVKPGWASKTQDFWAPHVAQHRGVYYLYYSAKPDAALTDPSRGLCLAVATASRPEGPFTDIGKPLQCGPASST
jgi:arabinan endo-1,5-alpha-L-arabinosidase